MLLKVQGNPYFNQMYENEMNITNIMITFKKNPIDLIYPLG